MQQIRSTYVFQHLEKLKEEATALTFNLDGSGAEMANGVGVIPPWLNSSDHLRQAVSEIARLRKLSAIHVMLNRLPPGVVVDRHRDWVPATPLQKDRPTLERWHLPLITNLECWWWDEEENRKLYMQPGVFYGPVPYWKIHQVGNEGTMPRIHLVVDLDCAERIGHYEEELFGGEGRGQM
jgi:hypothetical protein